MKWRKFMHNSFAANNEAWSGVTTVDSLTSDLYYHYSKLSAHWKLSGDTVTTASTPIFEDSVTTSIVVTPNPITGSTAGTQQLAVVNQDAVNVITECTFSATTAAASVSVGGLITFGAVTGTTSIKVTHSDIPGTPTTVPVYIFWTGNVSITAGNGPLGIFTGITGGTYQAHATMDTGGYDVTTVVSWTSGDVSKATVGLHTGLITFVGAGSTTITATYPTGLLMSRGVTVTG